VYIYISTMTFGLPIIMSLVMMIFLEMGETLENLT
jgi:hypothetical protein